MASIFDKDSRTLALVGTDFGHAPLFLASRAFDTIDRVVQHASRSQECRAIARFETATAHLTDAVLYPDARADFARDAQDAAIDATEAIAAQRACLARIIDLARVGLEALERAEAEAFVMVDTAGVMASESGEAAQ